MKPITLKMTAFGPYAKQVHLNFKEGLQTQDIFIITGPTGAGKTTIFDAICYALYGETSGASRKGEDLRSDFSATVALKTEVEFIFSVKDKLYRIVRAPKQKQRKKRGSGMTEVPAAIEFCELDSEREPLTKDQEIRQEINQILGLNVDQFRKIVMIPQGDFKEFLYANTTNKEELLRKIFGTDLFKAIQEQLHDRATFLKANVAQIMNAIQAELAVLNIAEDLELQHLIQSNSRLGVIFAAVKRRIEEFDEKEGKWKERLMRLDKELQEIQKKRQEAIRINELFQKQEKATQYLITLEHQLPEVKEKEQVLLAAQLAGELLSLENEVCKQETVWRQLNQQLQKTTQKLIEVQNEFVLVNKCYDAIAELKQEVKLLIKQESQLTLYHQDVKKLNDHQRNLWVLKQRKERLDHSLQQNRILAEQIETQLSPLEDVQKKLEQLKEQGFKLQLAIPQTEGHLQAVHAACEQSESLQRSLKNCMQLKKQFDAQSQKLSSKRENYEHQGRLFIKAAAIRLANNLQIGQACPVCGSTEHPNPSKTNEFILTERELNQLRDELDQSRIEVQSCWEKFTALEMKVEEEKRALNQSCELIKQQQPQLEHVDLTRELLGNLKAQWESTVVEQEMKLKDITHRQQQLQREVQQLLQLKETYQLLKDERSQLEKEAQEHEVQYLTYQETLKSMIARIPESYQDLNTLETKLKHLQLKRSEYEENICQSEADYQKVSQNLTVLETTKTHLQQQIEQSEKGLHEARVAWEVSMFKSFPSPEHYQLAKRSKEQIQQLIEDIQAYQQEVHTTNHFLEQLALDLEGKEQQNLTAITQMILELEQQRETIRQEMTHVHLQCQHYQQVLTSATKKYQKVQQQEEQYGVVGELAELANGRTAGKMSFETYVLSSYFDEVLTAANQRLMKMSSGRYYLLRREEVRGGGRKGLDLDVYDSHTCKKRPVNTLSGGESFKASLALALGLSDTVQQNAGGIQLDTMFIDEGFGTLDSDSLEQAIDILMDLQDYGRLIGIISHVNELKERIPAKLVVKASPEGSTAHFET